MPRDHGERRQTWQVTAAQGNTTKQHSLARVGYGTNGPAELSIARQGQQRIQTDP
jgi:hypothetical protein